MDKTWLEVEIGESVDLLRDRLEIINDMDADDMDCDDVHEIHEIYATMHTINQLKSSIK